MAWHWIFLVVGLSMVSSFPSPAAAGFSEDCERLAADPEEPNKRGAGVALEDIESRAAWMACAQAVRGPIGGKPGSTREREPEPETTYRFIRASLAEGPAQDIRQAIEAARRIAGEAEHAPDKGRLSPEVVEWYVERGRQYYAPAAYAADAKAGKAAAQMALFIIHVDPYLRNHDPAAAEVWLAKAVAQDYPAAMLVEGRRRLKVAGSPEESREAVNLILKAATRENASAQWEMALLYLRGEHVRKDRQTAKGWARLAAERMNEDAAKWLRDQNIDTGTAVVGSILAAMIAAAIIDGLTNDNDISDKALSADQRKGNSNCRGLNTYNPYLERCEDYFGNPEQN